MGAYGKIILLCLVAFVNSNPLPVQKCVLTDGKCMQKAFQDYLPVFMAGIPEIGTEVIDVLQLDKIAFDLAGLKFTLTEGKLKGLKNTVIDKVKWDTNKNKIEIKYHVDCSIKGHYTAGGRVLILPITGDGQLKLKMKNLAIRLFLEYDIKQNDGKDYVALTKYNFDFDVKDHAYFDMTNLFNGNKELSDTMLKFLNDNWRDVTKEFGTPIMDSAAKKIFKNVSKFFSKMPLEDIAIAKE